MKDLEVDELVISDNHQFFICRYWKHFHYLKPLKHAILTHIMEIVWKGVNHG